MVPGNGRAIGSRKDRSMSSAEYDNMSWNERRNAWRATLLRAQKQPVKQMTNKQILSKYFTMAGRRRATERGG